MSHKPFSAFLLAFALFTCPAFAPNASAQNASVQNNGPPAPQAAPATNKTDGLTPERAKQALSRMTRSARK